MISIIMKDGGILTCNEIEIYGNMIVADGYRRVPILDVDKIVPTEEE